jgi:hypothetical protein
MGEIVVRHPAEGLDALVIGVMLGAAEQDVALVTHQKIGVHHQVRQLVRHGMLRRGLPEVRVDLLHGVLPLAS